MKSWLQAPAFSPKGFVVRAAVVALVYALVSLAGLRDSMSVLSLTYPEGRSREWSVICCMTYLVSYFLWVLGVPILLLAAGLMKILTWVESRRRKPPPSSL